MRSTLQILLATGALIVLAACQNDSAEDTIEVPEEPVASAGESAEAPEEPATAEPTPADPSQSPEDDMNASNGNPLDLAAAIAAARSDLAERSGVAPDAITIAQARKVTWRSGALGCPEEGAMYTQALVEGFYIRLKAGEREYAYHAGRDGQPFHCPQARSQPPMDDEKPTS
jgi:hypothetical protein